MNISLSELSEVKGIGKKTIQRIREYKLADEGYISEYDDSLHLDRNSVNQGDCLDLIDNIKDNTIDLVVTSPPYYNAKKYSQWEKYDDYLLFLKKTFEKIFNKIKKGRMCAVNISCYIEPRKKRNDESIRYPIPFHFVNIMEDIGFKFLEDIVWVKPEGSAKNRNGGFYRHRKPVAYKPNIVNEYIFIFQKPAPFLIDKIVNNVGNGSLVKGDYERSNIWEINPKTNSRHPAPFPLDIPKKIIKYYSFEGDVVLDPMAGSGTTGVACQNTDRDYILIEQEEKYIDIIKERLGELDD